MSIVWSDEYSTGEPEIDKQHKQLFKYLADLEAHIASGVTDEYMKQFLDYLGLYTRSHFCYEEICMRQKKCPVAKQNQEQHDKLLQDYTHYRERFEIEGVSADLLNKLHAFLLSWLTNHILKIDTNLKACM